METTEGREHGTADTVPDGRDDVRLPPLPHVAWLRFDGKEAEYFRIWIVHTLLNVITIGIYSPWAKVRKARWFAQHTSLLDQRFDYHGRPLPILRGRVLALALFIAWSFAFDISVGLGIATFGLLCALGPLMFANAQRFRLVNTSWRGLRFDFRVPRRNVYRVCLPALLVWTIGSVLQAAGAPTGTIVVASVLAALYFPAAHAHLKSMQHSNATFSERPFMFERGTGAFYMLYLKAGGVLVLAGLAASSVTALLARVANTSSPATRPVFAFIVGACTVLVTWMLAWPYFAARMQAVVWPRTRWGEVGFRGEMRARELLGIVVKGGLLTLLTAGLFWPYLAVAIARYRVQSIAVVGEQSFDQIALRGNQGSGAIAVGDAAADFFGMDLGW